MAVTSRFAFQSALARRPAWHLVDASEHILGRLATQIAVVLQGKHKPFWEPSYDCGDYVVVLNAGKIQLSKDEKWKFKTYRWHTGHSGGFREMTALQMRDKHPTRMVQKAVHGMLPKNRLLAGREKRLRLFDGDTHDLDAQVEDPLNKMMIEALDFKWEVSRPKDVDPVRKYYPGWLVHLDQEGDFTVAHKMKLWDRPRSKSKLREWKPSEQIPVFFTALKQAKEARQQQKAEEQHLLDLAWTQVRRVETPKTLPQVVDPNPKDWSNAFPQVEGFTLPRLDVDDYEESLQKVMEKAGVPVPPALQAAAEAAAAVRKSAEEAAAAAEQPDQPDQSEQQAAETKE